MRFFSRHREELQRGEVLIDAHEKINSLERVKRSVVNLGQRSGLFHGVLSLICVVCGVVRIFPMSGRFVWCGFGRCFA